VPIAEVASSMIRSSSSSGFCVDAAAWAKSTRKLSSRAARAAVRFEGALRAPFPGRHPHAAQLTAAHTFKARVKGTTRDPYLVWTQTGVRAANQFGYIGRRIGSS